MKKGYNKSLIFLLVSGMSALILLPITSLGKSKNKQSAYMLMHNDTGVSMEITKYSKLKGVYDRHGKSVQYAQDVKPPSLPFRIGPGVTDRWQADSWNYEPSESPPDIAYTVHYKVKWKDGTVTHCTFGVHKKKDSPAVPWHTGCSDNKVTYTQDTQSAGTRGKGNAIHYSVKAAPKK